MVYEWHKRVKCPVCEVWSWTTEAGQAIRCAAGCSCCGILANDSLDGGQEENENSDAEFLIAVAAELGLPPEEVELEEV